MHVRECVFQVPPPPPPIRPPTAFAIKGARRQSRVDSDDTHINGSRQNSDSIDSINSGIRNKGSFSFIKFTANSTPACERTWPDKVCFKRGRRALSVSLSLARRIECVVVGDNAVYSSMSIRSSLQLLTSVGWGGRSIFLSQRSEGDGDVGRT